MRFATLYRDKLENKTFTDALMCICSSKGDKLVLGYGYSNSNIFDDEKLTERFKKNINKGFEGIKNPNIIIIGCKGTYPTNAENKEKNEAEKENYKNFVKKLKEVIDNDKVNITTYLSKNNNFHNKIAFKTNYGLIKILMTGSSNLTRNTLYIEKHAFFNKEHDILVWDECELKDQPSILSYIEKNILETRNMCRYSESIKKDLNIDSQTINGINLNSYIISPFEIYNLKEQLKRDINSGDFEKFIV